MHTLENELLKQSLIVWCVRHQSLLSKEISLTLLISKCMQKGTSKSNPNIYSIVVPVVLMWIFYHCFWAVVFARKQWVFFLSYLAPWSAKFFLLTFFKSGKQYSVVTLVGRIVQQAAIIRRISSICTWNVEQA